MTIKAVQQRILARFTRPPDVGKIAAAVSGGCDSVAMLLLLREWCAMRGIRLCVFHVDHALRADSHLDAIWVEELAAKMQLEFHRRTADAGTMIAGETHGSESWARQFRYRAFADMLVASGAAVVATGHSADDQAETVMMRLLRGSSWQGLGGIGSRVKLQFAGQTVRVWRPLLNVCRPELEEFLQLAGQNWREDSTNATLLYFRNRVRHQLLPLMVELHRGTLRHLVALSGDARALHQYLSRSAQKYLAQFGTMYRLRVYITPKCTLRLHILKVWVSRLTGHSKVSRAFMTDLDNLWVNKKSGRQVIVGGFSFRRQAKEILAEPVAIIDPAKDCAVACLRPCPDQVSINLQPGVPVEFAGWRFSLTAEQPLPDGASEVFPLDPGLAAALCVRTRLPGDIFSPAGGAGRKKLARWLIDKKVPIGQRATLPLLVAAGQIILVAGYSKSSLLRSAPAENDLWVSVCKIN